MSQFEIGNFENAIADFDEAIRSNGQDAAAYVFRGKARLQAWVTEGDEEVADRDFDEAIRLCDDAIRRDPTDAMVHLRRGQAWSGKVERDWFFRYGEGERDRRERYRESAADSFEGAARLLGESIRQEPNNAGLYYHRWEAHSGLADWYPLFRRIHSPPPPPPTPPERLRPLPPARLRGLRTRDGSSDPVLNTRENGTEGCSIKASIKASINARENAKKDLAEAIRLDPTNVVYHARSGNLDEAIRLDPKTALYYVDWWPSLEKRMPDLDTAIRLNPDFARAYYHRGRAWFSSKNYEKAIADFSEAIRLRPHYALRPGVESPYGWRARALWELGQFEAAVQDCRTAIRLDPREEGPHYFAAGVARDAESLATSPDERRRDGRRAIQLATWACEMLDWTNCGEELNALAAAYAEVGRFDEAVSYQAMSMDGSHTIQPRDPQERLATYRQRKPYRASR
jgi:tetratricopeptide (TPR) repeat protein